MEKREKIILVIMALAVLYGVYNLFLASPKKASLPDPEQETKQLNSLVAEVSQNLAKGALSETDTYIIARAEAEWVRDPFYEKKIDVVEDTQERQVGKAQVPDEIPFDYSGYLEMGNRKLAIINGMEYQTGDELEPGGYVLRSISGTRVSVEVKGKQVRVVVPIVEEIL